MILALVSFDNDNKLFLTNLSRYNNLLNSYYNNDDKSLESRLIKTFKNLIGNCIDYKILNEEQSEIYNTAMNFLAKDIEKNDLNVIDNTLSKGSTEKLGNKLLDFNSESLKEVSEFSKSMLHHNNQIEILYVPSIIDVNNFFE